MSYNVWLQSVTRHIHAIIHGVQSRKRAPTLEEHPGQGIRWPKPNFACITTNSTLVEC